MIYVKRIKKNEIAILSMLDILTIIHDISDIKTAARIRRVCRKLALLQPRATLYLDPGIFIEYEYRVGKRLHRLDGPAIHTLISDVWYRAGVKHREYHPCIIKPFGIDYMVFGKPHNETGPARICISKKCWYRRGMFHRKTGPAYDSPSSKKWYTLGMLHRLDGPVYDNVYMIRGRRHRIYNSVGKGCWRINDDIIR